MERSLCGASSRNSNCNPFLVMSRGYLFPILQRAFYGARLKPINLLTDVLITVLNFRCISLTYFSQYCAGTSAFLSVLVAGSSRRALLIKVVIFEKTLKFSELSWVRLKLRL